MAFVTAADERKEREVADILEQKWDCTLRKFGKLDPIDFWAERDGEVVAFFEIKCRNIPSTQYSTVFVTLRKFLDLLRAKEWSQGNSKAFVVLRWTDVVGYIEVSDLPPGKMSVLRRVHQRAENDTEPAFEVPVSSFTMIHFFNGGVQ